MSAKLARYERAFVIARILGALARWYDWAIALLLLASFSACVWYGSAALAWPIRAALAGFGGFIWGRVVRHYVNVRLGNHAGGGLLCAEAFLPSERLHFRRACCLWGGLPLFCLAMLAGLLSVLCALAGYGGGFSGNIQPVMPQEGAPTRLTKQRRILSRRWLVIGGALLPAAMSLVAAPDVAAALVVGAVFGVAWWSLRMAGGSIRFMATIGYGLWHTIWLILQHFWPFPAAVAVSALCFLGSGVAFAVVFVAFVITAHSALRVIAHRLFQDRVAQQAPWVAWALLMILVLDMQIAPGLGPVVVAILVAPFVRRARRMTWRL